MKGLKLYIFRLFFIVCLILMMASCNEKKQFDGYLYPIRENGLYGYIDSVGNRIIEPAFLWVSTFHNGLAMAVVDTIYRVVPDSMAYEVGERDTIINVYRMYAKYGYINKSGKFAIAPRFVSYVNMTEIGDVTNDMDDCSNALYRNSFRNKRAMFYDTTTWKNGYIDTKGKIVVPPKYYYSEPFSEGLAVVRDAVAEPLFTNKACITPSKLRCAYLDTLGNAVTEFKYESLTRFCSGRGIGNYKKINKENIDIADTAIVWETYSIPRFLINKDGKEIKELDFNYDYYGFGKDGISVSADGFFIRSFVGKDNISYYFIDTNGDFLEPLKGLFEYQLDSLEKCNDIMQVLPENAKISAATFFNDGFAGISPDKKHWFVIDKFYLIHGYGDESIFDGFRAFNNGLAPVKKNGKWGFINRKIKEQIPCKYDSCGAVYPYLEDIFEYNIQGDVKKKAYINRKDSLVWESPLYNSEKIENRYSVKESKDYGKWTYHFSILKQIPLGAYGAAGFVLLLLIIICAMIIRNPQRKETDLIIASPTQITDKEEIKCTPQTNNEEIGDDHLYPSVGQYAEIIKLAAKTPEEYFDKLSHLHPVLDDNGEPVMSSGNFAVVFKMKDEYGKQYAVRCFHRAQQGRERNYKMICEELSKVSSPYMSPIKYYEKELFVESGEYPVLLMDWVEGMTLDKYIRRVINDKKALIHLAANFRDLAIWLLAQPFAHGDLKPDNILVREDGSLVLVDYDGMFVPAMQGQKAREIGSPDFRSPSRTIDVFDKEIDNFSIITILLSLELLIEKKDYLSSYGAEDRLLFSKADYDNLDNSEMYKIAYSSYNDDISELALELKTILRNDEDSVSLISLLKRKETRKIEKRGNGKLEKISEVVILLYNLAIPIFAYVYSRIIRPEEWNVLGVSLGILGSSMILYLMINILDVFRPYKGSHLFIDDDVTSYGCVLGMFEIFIPIGCLLFSVVDQEWYITILMIGIWISFFYINANLCSGNITYFTEIFKPHDKKDVIIENEKNKIRSEIRKKEKQRIITKSQLDKQKRDHLYGDLPF